MRKVVAIFMVVVVVAVIGTVLGVAVVGDVASVASRPSVATVGYLGDSITDQARVPLVDDLGADPVMIRAVPGIKIELMVGPATNLAADLPDQVVINLGTNNVLAGSPVAGEVAAFLRLVDLFPDARCVHLVTINEHMIQPDRDVNIGARELNDQLHALAAEIPRVRIVDWAKIVNDYDAAGDPDGPVTTDTVHPAPAGQKLLLDAYRASIASC